RALLRHRFGAPPRHTLTLYPHRRLIRFPIFWCGALILAVVICQGLNPWWVFQSNADRWWLLRVADVPWLPAGIRAPFTKFDGWRQAIIYADGWMLGCSIWIG